MLQALFCKFFCYNCLMAKKYFQRWYEKNEYLKAFMNLMQDLPIDIQCEIAVDMIIRVSSIIDRDYNKIIEEVSNYNPKDFKRWYDKNPNIHVAIESLRDLTPEERDEIVQEFCDRILNSHYIKIKDIK